MQDTAEARAGALWDVSCWVDPSRSFRMTNTMGCLRDMVRGEDFMEVSFADHVCSG